MLAEGALPVGVLEEAQREVRQHVAVVVRLQCRRQGRGVHQSALHAHVYVYVNLFLYTARQAC